MGENESLEQTEREMNLQIYKLGKYFCTHDAPSALQGGIQNITRISYEVLDNYVRGSCYSLYVQIDVG